MIARDDHGPAYGPLNDVNWPRVSSMRHHFMSIPLDWKVPTGGLLFTCFGREVNLLTNVKVLATNTHIRDSLGVIVWELEFYNWSNGWGMHFSDSIPDGWEFIGIRS